MTHNHSMLVFGKLQAHVNIGQISYILCQLLVCSGKSGYIVAALHVTSVLFLVRFNNFALTIGFYWSYTLLL